MLVVPHSHDQPDNAHRVTRLGVARTLYPHHYKAPRVARELQRLLSRPSYARNGERVAAIVRQEDGAATAAELISE
jgi:UDP:flavonoid glycosyltransferase YjiC (YdhE family)